MTGPRFSVVIPVFDRADRIAPILESVRQQDFEDFECIVVDDGSSDGARLEAVVAGLEDDRFRYVRQSNGGASSARNRGMDLAQGRYLALLDSDDCFLPGKLSHDAARLRDASADVLLFSRVLVDRGLARTWTKPPRGPTTGERIDEYLMCRRGWAPTSTLVLPTALARRVRFDETLPSGQDTDFVIRVVASGAQLLYSEAALVVLDDSDTGARVSRNPSHEPLEAWLDRMRGRYVGERAYWGYRGWHVAKRVAATNRLRALGYYLAALARGCYSPRHALVVAAQVFVSPRGYQWFASSVLRLFGSGSEDATRRKEPESR